jgi:hypothetical protein
MIKLVWGPKHAAWWRYCPYPEVCSFSQIMVCANVLELDVLREGLRRERHRISLMKARLMFIRFGTAIVNS